MSAFPIDVQEVEGAGRGAFASRDVVAGEVLIRNAPAALVPSDAAFLAGTVCTHCLSDIAATDDVNATTPTAPPRCAGPCKLAVFCGRCSSDPEVLAMHADECTSLSELFDPATRSLYCAGRRECSHSGEGGNDTDVLRVVLQLLHLRTRWLKGDEPRPITALHASEDDLLVDSYDNVEEMDNHDEGKKWLKYTS